MRLLGGVERMALAGGLALRLLSAQEVLEARREAAQLMGEERERALCANACLLARALERGKRAAFSDGRAVLEGLTPTQIAQLSQKWTEFSQQENPSPQVEEGRLEGLKKAWSTRLTRAFGGVCSASSARYQQKHGQEK